jgi:hypothetical protein
MTREGADVAIDIRPEVLIHRSRRDVAAFMFDPANDLAWTGGITASIPARPGPLVVGATVERTARFLGRTFSYGYVVTAHDPDRLVEMRVDKPFPMLIRYELDDDQDGATRVAIHTTGTPGGFFGLTAPLMTRQVRNNITADLHRLRDRLENGPPTEP